MGHFLTAGLVESLAEAPWQVAPGTNEILMRIRFALGSLLRSQHKSIWWPTWDLRKKNLRSPGLVDHLRSLLEASLEICPNLAVNPWCPMRQLRWARMRHHPGPRHAQRGQMMAMGRPCLRFCEHAGTTTTGLVFFGAQGVVVSQWVSRFVTPESFLGKWKLSLGTKILRHVRIPTKC